MKQLPVTFFYPYPEELEAVKSLDPDRDWNFFSTGSRIWILQTYLRLKQAGHPVDLSATVPAHGIVVFHPYNLTAFERQGGYANRDLIVVVACGDRVKHPPADIKILQNSKHTQSEQVFFIHCWPQPGLRPRDRNRNSEIKTIAFKGYTGSLNSVFKSARWHNFLQDVKLTWLEDGLDWAGPNPNRINVAWNDYSSVDLLLAVRPDFKNLYHHKPASKLINAWLAGVPALLGPESAYRALRQSNLDYIEVASLDDVIQGIELLIEKPMLYEAMIENGLERAKEVTPARIVEVWAHGLFEEIPSITKTRIFGVKRSIPLKLKRKTQLLKRRIYNKLL